MIMKEYAPGGFKYTLNGRPHRPNGPAFIGDYNAEPWYLYGKRHRYYGPALYKNEWRIHGVFIK